MERKQTVIVSGILQNNHGEVLLAKRPLHKKIAPGVYHLPGGHVDFGENLQNALKREIKEEFNLDITVHDIIRTFSYINKENTIHTIGITFVLKIENIPKYIRFDKNDTNEIVWVSKKKITNYLPDEDHDYITLIKFFKEYNL